ncbi:MAG: WD40 repeat domain-containing protein [Minicystis sp.]
MPAAVRLLVEENLLTPDNRRDTIAIGRVGAEGVAEADVRKLVDRRLLRKEPRLGHEYVEIVHDKLVPTIAAKRDERRRRERDEAERKEKEAAEEARRAREAEEQQKREEELREKAEEEKQRAEAEKLRAEAERLRADAERLRAEEGERRRELAEKLAATRKRRTAILWVLVAVLAFTAAFLPTYVVWTARQTDKQKKTAAGDARIEENDKRAADLADLAWRAAADQRWDDVARMLSSAYHAVDDSRRIRAELPATSVRGSRPEPAAPPLLALLASRFEANAGRVETTFADASGIGTFVLTPDGRVAAQLGTDGLNVKLIDLSGKAPARGAKAPGKPGAPSEKELGPKDVEVIDTFSGAIRGLATSGDGALLFGQGDKGQIVVWRIADGERRLGFRTRLARPRLSVDRAGRRLVLWDRDVGKAMLVALDVAEDHVAIGHAVELSVDHPRSKPPGPSGWAFVGDWSAIVPTPDGAHVVGLWDDTWLREADPRERKGHTDVTLWSASGGRSVAHVSIPGHVSSASLSEDGALLAALSDDGDVRVFRLGEGRLDLVSTLPQRLPKEGWISFQDRQRALLVATEGTIALWDLASPEAPKQRFEITTGGLPRSAVIAPGGKEALVWAGDEIRLYDLALGQPRAAAPLPEAERRGGPGVNVQLRAYDGGRRVITARDDALRVRSLGGDERPLDRYLWGEAVSARATFSSILPRAGIVEDVADDGDTIAVLADGAVSLVRAGGPNRLQISAFRPKDPALVRAARLRGGRIAALDGSGGVRFGDARVSTLRHARDEAGAGGLLALAEGGAWAATAGRGPKVYVWDADGDQLAWAGDVRQKTSASPYTGDEVAVTAIAVTADEPEHPRVIVGDARGGVRAMKTGGAAKRIVWSTVGFDPSPHHEAVHAVEIGPAGRIATGAEDGTIALWEKDGRIVRTWTIEAPQSGAVRVLRFADEGRLLVSGGADGAAHVWRTTDGAEVCTVKHGDEITGIALERGAAARAASVDASGTAVVWKIATCEPIRSLRGMAYAGFLAAAHDRVVTVRRTGRVELWPTSGAGSDVPRDSPRGTAAWGVFLGADTLATGDEEGSLFAWKLSTASAPPEQLAGEIGGIPAVASANNRAVAITPEGLVRAWSSGTIDGGFAGRLPIERGWSVRAAALADGGQKLFTLEEGPDAALRGRTFTWPKWTEADAATELRGGTRCDASAGAAGRVFAASATDHGVRALVVDGSGCARIWDQGGKLVVEDLGPSGSTADPSGRVAAAAIGGTGDRLLLASSDGAVSTWEIEGDALHRLALERRRHTARVRAVAFHPGGRFAVTAGDDDQAWLWDTRDGRPLARLGAHPAPIHWVAFRPDGDEVVTGGADGWMRVWSTRTETGDPQHVLDVLGAWLPELRKQPAAGPVTP